MLVVCEIWYSQEVVNRTGFLCTLFGPTLKSSLIELSIVDTGLAITDFRWAGNVTDMWWVVGKSGQLV